MDCVPVRERQRQMVATSSLLQSKMDKQHSKTMFGLLLLFQLTHLASHAGQTMAMISSATPSFNSPPPPSAAPLLQQVAVTPKNSSEYSSNLAPHKINPLAQIGSNTSVLDSHAKRNDSQVSDGKIANPAAPSIPSDGVHTPSTSNQDDTISTGDYIVNIGSNDSAPLVLDINPGQDISKTRYTLLDSETSESSSSKAHLLSLKSRRQADNYHQPSSDWWTKLKMKTTGKPSSQVDKSVYSSMGEGKTTKQKSKFNVNQPAATIPTKSIQPVKGTRVVYQEQPLSQNTLLTIRYQLAAIRSLHKTLVTQSMPQLQQLDDRLIEYYKLCLKKKMPLYAGMLYRTRDFTQRMAKEVKHEREVLEAMAKQIQNVLRQKLTNQTLVREYNKLAGGVTTIGGHNFRLVPIKESTINKIKKATSTTQLPETIQPQQQSATNSTDSSKSIQESDPIATKRPKQRYTISVNEVNLKKELNKIQALIDRINESCHELNSVVDDINYLFKLKPQEITSRKGISLNNGKINKSHQQELGATSFLVTSTGSSNYVYDPKRRKPVKSPVRIYLEKYGKLTMQPDFAENMNVVAGVNSTTTTNTDLNPSTILPQRMKPLFEPSSLIYSDPMDQDLGFDDNPSDHVQ